MISRKVSFVFCALYVLSSATDADKTNVDVEELRFFQEESRYFMRETCKYPKHVICQGGLGTPDPLYCRCDMEAEESADDKIELNNKKLRLFQMKSRDLLTQHCPKPHTLSCTGGVGSSDPFFCRCNFPLRQSEDFRKQQIEILEHRERADHICFPALPRCTGGMGTPYLKHCKCRKNVYRGTVINGVPLVP